ncbi:MAG: hypothetical protein ABR559_06715 [Gemmatimonadota bacterium]
MRRAVRFAACLGLLGVVLAACRTGEGEYRQAKQPGGVTVQLDLGAGRTASGELLEVGDGGLLLVRPNWEFMRFPYGVIQRARFAQFEDLTLTGSVPTAAQRERLRLLSRFPQGLTPDLKAALLATRNQPDFTTWTP